MPLVLVPAASRLAASGGRPDSKEKKKIVIASPEKEIVVDGDRVVVWDDDDEPFPPELWADLPDFDDADFPHNVRFHGHWGGGYLGVRSVELTPELRQHFGAPKDAGVMVGTVEPDSPAAKAGIQVGDILTAVDGDGVGSTRDLSRAVRRHKDGETVKVDLLRDRSKKTLSVTVAERKDREIRIGDFGHGKHGFGWRGWDSDGPAVAPVPPVPPIPPAPPVPPDAPRGNGLRERMDSLEQRLKEIESRLPPQ